MNCIQIGLLYTVLILQFLPHLQGKKKIVKLIVPHTIKYIHHTHVLVVKPRKKKKVVNDDIEDDSNYVYHHITVPKRKHRYVAPYADAKEVHVEGSMNSHEGYNQFLVPNEDQRKKFIHEQVGRRLKTPIAKPFPEDRPQDYHPRYMPYKTAKPPPGHLRPMPGQLQPTVGHKQPYHLPSESMRFKPSITHEAPSKYTIQHYEDPEDYDTKYLGQYDTYSDDYTGLTSEETSWSPGVMAPPDELSIGSYAQNNYVQNSYMTLPPQA